MMQQTIVTGNGVRGDGTETAEPKEAPAKKPKTDKPGPSVTPLPEVPVVEPDPSDPGKGNPGVCPLPDGC